MREILFRGKRKDNGEWVDGDCFKTPLTSEVANSKQSDGWYFLTGIERCCIARNKCAFEVIPETVGQYTGLTDKNGNKIFEGDILKLWSEDLKQNYVYLLPVIYCELWCQFVLDDERNKEQFSIWRDFGACEIIGNIHDNPELLKGE